jgi:hypothetical protein
VNYSNPSTRSQPRAIVVVKNVLIGALLFAIGGGLAGALLFGVGPTNPGNSHGFALVMAPAFAAVGAIMGAFWGLVIGLFRAFKR